LEWQHEGSGGRERRVAGAIGRHDVCRRKRGRLGKNELDDKLEAVKAERDRLSSENAELRAANVKVKNEYEVISHDAVCSIRHALAETAQAEAERDRLASENTELRAQYGYARAEHLKADLGACREHEELQRVKAERDRLAATVARVREVCGGSTEDCVGRAQLKDYINRRILDAALDDARVFGNAWVSGDIDK